MTATAARFVAIAKDLLSEDENALALGVLEEAERRFPRDLDVLVNLMSALWQAGQPEKALAICLRALELAPEDPGMHHNTAMIAGLAGDYAIESRSLARMVAARQEDPQLHFRLAESLDRQGRFREAIAEYERAIALNPAAPDYHVHLGYALLRLGEWPRGWDEMAWYWRPEGLGKYSGWWQGAPCPKLETGDAVAGKAIVMCSWGGAGDVVMFARMAARLSLHGAARVTFHVTSEAAFLQRNRWGIPVVECGTAEACDALYRGHDAWIAAPQVPAILGRGVADVACEEPYLTPDPQRQAAWREKLGTRSGRPRIGIAWSGNPTNIYERNRSIPTAKAAQLLRLADVDWYVVQKNARNAELRELAIPGVHDFSEDCSDMGELAALCSQLDLVISIDSLPAHLAASMAVPTWLLLCSAADWRWGVVGETTTWYRGMRIFRQRTLGDWDELLGRVGSELAGQAIVGLRPS